MKTNQTNKLISLFTQLTLILLLSSFLIFSGCATQNKSNEPESVNYDDYPTQAIVEYVLGCMNYKGEQTYTTMYQCTCRFDAFKKQLTYEEYNQAVVFRNLKNTPGENGAVFRDPPQAKIMREKLKKAQDQAIASCEPS